MPRQKALDKAAELAPGLAERPGSVPRREDETGKTWDERHKPTSFRIRAQDADRLEVLAEKLGLSKDALGAALVWAALDAIDAGWLILEPDNVETEVVDKLGRLRFYTRKRARPLWQAPRSGERNDSTSDAT